MVGVRLNKDLLDDQGLVQVPSGFPGNTLAIAAPPRAPACLCEFLIEQGSTQRWLDVEDLIFDDGDTGFVRALVTHGGYTVEDIRRPSVLSEDDFVTTNGRLQRDPGVLDLVLSSGLTIRLSADFNDGRLRADLQGVAVEGQVVAPDIEGDIIVLE